MAGRTVILANGEFPQAEHCLKELQEANAIVCCDGAAQALLEHGLEPTAVIGDLDSLPPALKARLGTRLHRVAEQETNDLNKAFRFCLAQNWHDLTILGATGKREDHALGNISLLADFARQAPGIRMLTDYGEFRPLLESARISCRPSQPISIFALDAGTPLFSEGLQYPLNGLEPASWWEATLNVATGDSFSLSFPSGKRVLVYLALRY